MQEQSKRPHIWSCPASCCNADILRSITVLLHVSRPTATPSSHISMLTEQVLWGPRRGRGLIGYKVRGMMGIYAEGSDRRCHAGGIKTVQGAAVEPVRSMCSVQADGSRLKPLQRPLPLQHRRRCRRHHHHHPGVPPTSEASLDSWICTTCHCLPSRWPSAKQRGGAEKKRRPEI